MPKIVIRDEDTTSVSGIIENDYAVFIPGLSTATTPPDKPTFFNSLAAFKVAIGDQPAVWGSNSTPDRSYIYACELLGAGLPVVYKVITVRNLESATEDAICAAIAADSWSSEILDKGSLDISFVTSGGYPAIYSSGAANMVSKLTTVASTRGDCFALIDLPPETDLTTQGASLPSSITGNAESFIVTPWIDWTPVYSGEIQSLNLPGSFAYLRAFANSIKNNSSWFAVAGVKRGLIGTNGTTVTYTNAEADALQPNTGLSVNAITYIKPYGFTIWGNRTLNSNTGGLTANSFVNIRQLVHEIKRHLYKVARGLMFEPNDDILWVNFRNAVTPLLDKMQSGQGISSYRLIRQASSARATLTAKIIIVPIEAVENFELTVILTDEDTVVNG